MTPESDVSASVHTDPSSARPTSPARLFWATIAWIFGVELATMWFIEGQRLGTFSGDSLLDALTLIFVATPLVYLLLYRPMVRSLKERETAEAALRDARDELERRVARRTAELESSNRRLREEAEDRKRADARSRFQAELLDNVEQGVIATDLQGRILFWNRHSERLYGWPADEVHGRSIAELFPETPGYDLAGPMCMRLGEGQDWVGEVDLRRKDGTFFPAQLSCFPVLDGQRRPVGIVHLATDITGRRAAASALEYSERKYSTLVESSPTGIFIAREGKFVFVNPKLEEISGYSREELVESAWLRLIHPDDCSRLEALAERTRAGEEPPESCGCRLVTKQGAVRWIDVRWTPISYRGSVSSIGSVQDVTGGKEAEAALARSRESLHRLSARLLTAQEDERGRVARDLHDGIGQTLSAIKFALERALNAGPSEQGRRETSSLAAVVPAIQEAMEEVRRISMALRPSMLDDLGLLATLGWLCRELQSAHPEVRVETRLELEEKEVPESLKIVAFRIAQEATNNAVKHSQASRIVVALQRSDAGLELSVEDDGVGFDVEEARSAATRKGLGLGTMKERADLSGGSFALLSASGRGAAVRVLWPLSA